jgi:ATP-binding cassette subfamily F protein uup
MILLSAHEIEISLGGRTLFQRLSFSIEKGNKIALIGANGVGKSTLCKIITGEVAPDKGSLSKTKSLSIGFLSQTPTVPKHLTIIDALQNSNPNLESWEADQKAHELYSRFQFQLSGLEPTSSCAALSGGWQKKLALAIELMREPDLLILDEPTNHLDVESILWLEDYLSQSSLTYIVITHDRAFLNAVSNNVWELDPSNIASQGLLKIEGDYTAYCDAKNLLITALHSTKAKAENTLRRETEWLRRGPKARTTKQNARIERAHELQEQVQSLKDLTKERSVSIAFQTIEGTPKKLVEAQTVEVQFGQRKVISDFTFTLQRGDKIGLIGANGSGKSTLIKTLMGELIPTHGAVKLTEGIKIAYFDQSRAALNPKDTVFKVICPQGEYVQYRGKYIHANGYLERFLFSSNQTQKVVSKLSGGEQARLLIARLMLQECHLLILDEPTNDLDIATLDILEAELKSFEGALIIVSHDRYFLDQVANVHFYIHDGKITRYTGVHQWEQDMLAKDKNPTELPEKTKAPTVSRAPNNPKLSFKEKFELENMEKSIESLEARCLQIQNEIDIAISKNETKELSKLYASLAESQSLVEKAYKRWEELNAKSFQ